MRSLRLRFFLISWPLVVAAIAIVAFRIDRTTLELERVEVGSREMRTPIDGTAWADLIASSWPARDADLARLVATSPAPVDLLVLGNDGAPVAASRPGIGPVASGRQANGAMRLHRRDERGGLVAEAEYTLKGIPVRDAAGSPLGELFVLPLPHEPELPGPAVWRARLRRTMWTAALVASAAAAAAAFLLAAPLVRRVRRLTEASTAIASGSLEARVESPGRDELGRLGHSFNAMAHALQQAESHKRNLVSDAAHELRTPLTNIIALVESMQDGLRNADAATLASLRDEAGRLAALVDELQELSLAESGQIAYYLEPVDAAALARSEIDAILPSAGGVAIAGPEGVPSTLVLADARRLSQVLRNLLKNAIANTPSDGTITVLVSPDGPRVRIDVADSGRGIPAEHIDLIWERFHRVDPSRDRASGGMGIGLALVRQLVHGMRGEIEVESEVGKGSRFRVSLPRPPAQFSVVRDLLHI